nr:aldo/keto reductase [Streptomyces sp. SID4948]
MGASGLQVSALCLGTASFGRQTGPEQAHRMLDAFTDAGGIFIDTADLYQQGAAERIVGDWLAGRDRDGLVVATKVFRATGTGPNDAGLSRKHILAAAEASLRRLRTDHIDLYQTHVADVLAPLEETAAALDGLVTAGKVRYLGASNHPAGRLQKSLDLARQRGLEPYTALQPLYNLLHREVEWELTGLCAAEGLGILPWSPLDGGRLTGARALDAGPHAPADPPRARAVVDTLRSVAAEAGRSPGQVALRWLMDRPGVTAPIIGPHTEAQLADCLGALDLSLDPVHTARLDEVSSGPLPYPYDLLAEFRDRG